MPDFDPSNDRRVSLSLAGVFPTTTESNESAISISCRIGDEGIGKKGEGVSKNNGS